MVWISDEDWVNKCMEFRVEGRRSVGRPRRTWLESVEAGMVKLEIDREAVHDRKKLRKNVMKKKSNPFQKTDYKPIIILGCLFKWTYYVITCFTILTFILCV